MENLKDKIEIRAYEIYKKRQENNIPGCALGDWLDAQSEIFSDKRINSNCPVCGFKFLVRDNNEIHCLKAECDWKIEAKRKQDEQMPTLKDIKDTWD